jgi:hypothetical protein
VWDSANAATPYNELQRACEVPVQGGRRCVYRLSPWTVVGRARALLISGVLSCRRVTPPPPPTSFGYEMLEQSDVASGFACCVETIGTLIKRPAFITLRTLTSDSSQFLPPSSAVVVVECTVGSRPPNNREICV